MIGLTGKQWVSAAYYLRRALRPITYEDNAQEYFHEQDWEYDWDNVGGLPPWIRDPEGAAKGLYDHVVWA